MPYAFASAGPAGPEGRQAHGGAQRRDRAPEATPQAMVDVPAVGREQRAAREPTPADRGHDVQQRQGQQRDQGRERYGGVGPVGAGPDG